MKRCAVCLPFHISAANAINTMRHSQMAQPPGGVSNNELDIFSIVAAASGGLINTETITAATQINGTHLSRSARFVNKPNANSPSSGPYV